MFEFKLPDLGEGIHEGEILKWHVEVGGSVKEDDPLVDVETDKAAVTIPSPKEGRVAAINAKVGDTAKVGAVIVVLDDGTAAAAPPAPPAMAATPAAPAAPATPPSRAAAPAAVATQPVPAIPPAAPAAATIAPPAAPRGAVPAAPATRRYARELGIDINAVPGSGPGGRVGREDVERFAAAPAAAPEEEVVAAPPAAIGAGIPFLEIEPLPDFAQEGPVEREPIRSIRRKVAKKMTTSMILVPHVAHIDEADVTTLDEFRRRERERRAGQPGARMSLLPFVVKAVAAGLAEFPMFNASLDPARGEIVYKKYYNVGVAVDSGHGLVVPVVRGADRKSVLEIAAEIEDLAARARAGKLDAAEMRGGTFTITNVGPLGGTALIPTINYPESAILGMATAKPKPVVHEGQIVARTILPLTLAFDHRVADGADAARFVGALVRRLSEPLSWLFTAK